MKFYDKIVAILLSFVWGSVLITESSHVDIKTNPDVEGLGTFLVVLIFTMLMWILVHLIRGYEKTDGAPKIKYGFIIAFILSMPYTVFSFLAGTLNMAIIIPLVYLLLLHVLTKEYMYTRG